MKLAISIKFEYEISVFTLKLSSKNDFSCFA